MLVMASREHRAVGPIEFIKSVDDLDEGELSNQAYATSDRRRGARHAGTARGAWFHRGVHHDVEVDATLRDEVIEGSP